MEQILHLNVSKGCLNKHDINWAVIEIRHAKHPHLNEIKINQFLEAQKEMLQDAKVLIVENDVFVK